MVTGASAGIGKEIARGLARQEARVAIVCRDPARGAAAAAELRLAAPRTEVSLFLADVSVLGDVRRLAAELHDAYGRVDVLVNNAGTHDPYAAVSADGFDRMIATNHLGPFLLTHSLLDLLERGAPSRVIMIASESHRLVTGIDPMSFHQPGSYGPIGSMRVYARSKMLCVLFAQEAAERWRDRGVRATSVCPGFVLTDMSRSAPIIAPLFAAGARTPLVTSPAESVKVILRLATDPAFAHRGGEFHSTALGFGLLPKAFLRFNTGLQREVWERSKELVCLLPGTVTAPGRPAHRPTASDPDKTTTGGDDNG
ncbi:SDR family NAD(P)-dependent oxidoreductase [Streptomyces sp. NPDC097107]|uniref:SDR family NAD(P)-dependent oxidoreductase n=1 Tax=Streptomyces sp. NPDC097107 TaxID=3366089 RepID=UPI0037F98718